MAAAASQTSLSRRLTNFSLRAKGLLVISVPVVALLVSVVLIRQVTHRKDEVDQWLKSGLEMRVQLLNLYVVVVSAESAIRGYGLTGHEDGLQTFHELEVSIGVVTDKIKDLIHDTPEQRARLAHIRTLFDQRVRELKELRAFYEQAQNRGLPPPERLNHGKEAMDQGLMEMTALGTAEGRLLQDLNKANQEQQAWLQAGIIATAAIGLLGGLLGVLVFTRRISFRMKQLEQSASELELGRRPTASVSGTDELGRVSAAMSRAGSILATQDQDLKLALEGAEMLIWELEPEEGRIKYRTGFGPIESATFPAELLSATVAGWLAAIHTDDREAVRQKLDQIIRAGGAFQVEYRVIIRGGEVRWMAVKGHAHLLDTGKPDRLLGVIVDVTERRTAAAEIERQAHQLTASQEALEQQTRILRSILDSMGDGVVVADTEGKFLVFNPAAQQILGSREFFGDSHRWAAHYGVFLPDMVTLYPTDELPFVRAMRGESVDAAELFVRPAGAVEGTWASVTARPLRQEDGAIRGGVLVLRNITAEKRTADALRLAKQEAETANHAKSEFLSRMSHELRTPLNAILGFTQLLELSKLSDVQQSNIQHILKGGYHLLDLINEILDLARIEAGRLSLSPEPVPMREALKDALDLVRPLALERNIHISPDVAIRCDRHVRADRQRLKQVLLNLLSNAIKFNRPNGSVVVSCEENRDGRLRIEIADSGIGVSAEGLKKLFKPFERLTADQTDVGGSGLGLALSKRLVEAMDGTIGVESTVGLGSKFFIELEILPDPAEWLRSNPAMLELEQEPVAARRGTVLYIEDNVSNLRLIEGVLNHCPGVRLITAMQGQLGLDMAQTHLPDWILLDLHLPDISGEEVLRRLRQNPRTKEIPVTVLSADATRGQIARLMTAGARDYLTKPVDVRQLLQLLDQTLQAGEAQLVESSYAERDHSEQPNSPR